MKKRYVLAGSLAALVLVPDQITKLMVQASMPLWATTPVIPGFFDLSHVVNRGAAFGFLNRMDISWQVGFFIAVTLAALAVIGLILAKANDNERMLVMGLGLIMGGALGNLVDRVRLGMVIDFLDFYVGDYHWPAFNVADIGISIGAGCLLISLYGKQKHAPDTH